MKTESFESVARFVLSLKQNKSAETVAAATRQINRLILNFGELTIPEITPGRWQEYVVREQLRKDRTFYDDRKYMRMILIHAYNEGLTQKRVELKIPDVPSEVGRELSPEELKALRAAAGPTEIGFQIEIGWRMGLRQREMLKLRWAQVDLDEGVIRFENRQVKTRRGRIVAIPKCLLAEFKFRFERRRPDAEFVFEGRWGGCAVSNRTSWLRCRRVSGVKARWHDLRHTCATQMLRRGVPVRVVTRYLGMSRRVLERIYSHISLDELRKAAAKMASSKRSVTPPQRRVNQSRKLRAKFAA